MNHSRLIRGAFTATLLLATFQASAQLNNDNAPWEMFAARLIERLKPPVAADGVIRGFQLVKEPVQADWGNPEYGKAYFYSMAAYLTRRGEFYSKSDLTLNGQFKNFLSSLNLPAANEDAKKKIPAAQSAWTSSLDEFDKIAAKRDEAWAARVKSEAALPEKSRTKYDVWYDKNFGKKMGAAERAAETSAYEYAKLLNDAHKGYAGIGNLIAGLNANKMDIKFPQGKDEEVPRFNYVPDMAKFVKDGDEGRGFVESWNFKQTSKRESLTWSSRSGSAGVRIGWLRVGGGGGGSQQTEVKTKSGTGFDVTFKNFATFDITPGGWFDGNAIKALWEGPYMQGAIASKDKLFGPNGSFLPRVSRVVVVYKPSVTIRLEKSEYERTKSNWGASGSISVGPFGFRGGAAGGKDELQTNEAENSVTLVDNTGIPQVVAVFTTSYPE